MLTSSPEWWTGGVWPLKCSVTVLFWNVNTFAHREERFPATFQFVRKRFSLAWGTKKRPQKAVSLLNILKLVEGTQPSHGLLIWQQRVWADTRQSGTVPFMDTSEAAPLFAHLLWCMEHRMLQSARCFTGFPPARSLNAGSPGDPFCAAVYLVFWKI